MMAILAAAVTCYAGCNTGSPDAQAIHVLSCDTETGEARIVQSVKGLQGTTYFQIDRARRYLYSVVADKPADGRKRSCAVRFPIAGDGTLGAVERLAELPCEAPCHVALSADERRLAFAAYTSATAGTVRLADGRVLSKILPDEGVGPNALRQKKAYAHFAFFTPDGRRLGIVNLGCDRIHFFDPSTMEEDVGMRILAFDPGDGPRHAVWSRDGRFLYVLNELGSSVISFRFDGRAFARVGKWSMLPDGYGLWEADGKRLKSKAAAIKLTEDGKTLLASNRGHDSIALFSVDGETGRLERRAIAPLGGKFPRDFELLPGEKFVIVGHKMSDEIQVYRFDRAAASLTPVGKPLAAWRPLCFKFLPR